MKKFLSTIVALLLVILSLCGCTPKFTVHYIGVPWNGNMDGKHQIFQNRQQLDEFIDGYQYESDRLATYNNLMYNHRGEPTAFAEAIEKYDNSYFQSSALILISCEEGSGSVFHKVKSCEVTADAIIVDINFYYPPNCTADMALWHILIEIESGDYSNKTIQLNKTIKFQNNNFLFRLGLWSTQKP